MLLSHDRVYCCGAIVFVLQTPALCRIESGQTRIDPDDLSDGLTRCVDVGDTKIKPPLTLALPPPTTLHYEMFGVAPASRAQCNYAIRP